jgi:hypothetical protein
MRCLTAIFLFCFVAAQGATPADSLIRRESRYFFSVRSGMALCADCQFDGPSTGYFSTVHGIRMTPGSRLGIGVGVTTAAERMIIPMFGSLSIDLLGKKNKLFAEFNYGFARSPQGSIQAEGWTETVKVKSYWQPSIGYKIRYYDMRIGILAGIQSLKLKRTLTYPSWGWGWGWGTTRPGTPNSTELTYNASRFVIGLSVGWRD